MPMRSEVHRATRSLLLDVLDQCARHMDAVPRHRSHFKPVEYAAMAAMEDFERHFQSTPEHRAQDQMMFVRAQNMALEWLHALQELRRELPLQDELEHLPLWGRSEDLGKPAPLT